MQQRAAVAGRQHSLNVNMTARTPNATRQSMYDERYVRHRQPLHTFSPIAVRATYYPTIPFNSIIHITTSLLISPSFPHEASFP